MAIYLDYAATTPVHPEVLAAMMPYFSDEYANPSALHTPAAMASHAVEQARGVVADILGVTPEECVFTSGGTESDNWALQGAMRAAPAEKNRLLVSSIEHHAVLDTATALGQQGFVVETIPVGEDGIVCPEEVAKRIRPETALVSVMHANNEVGTVQPVAEIGSICREKGAMFHVDAVQSIHQLGTRIPEINADLVTLSGHKFYGPKGVGLLYVRRGTRMTPLHFGGQQERSRRAGTLNVPGIIGFAKALQMSDSHRSAESPRLAQLRDQLIAGVESSCPSARLSGHRTLRLPNNAHFTFAGIDGESLLLGLDAQGVYASAGAACSSGSTEPSHVLRAMGCDYARARGALRLTLGSSTAENDIDEAVEAIRTVVEQLSRLM